MEIKNISEKFNFLEYQEIINDSEKAKYLLSYLLKHIEVANDDLFTDDDIYSIYSNLISKIKQFHYNLKAKNKEIKIENFENVNELRKHISNTKLNIRLCEDYIEKNPNSSDIKYIKSDKLNMEKDLEELETLLNDYEKKHEQQRDKSADFLKDLEINRLHNEHLSIFNNSKFLINKKVNVLVYNSFKDKLQNTYYEKAEIEKIKFHGSLQSFGFLFSELIEKGYIEAPKRNGNNNKSAISRMILEHFEFMSKEEQPKPEDIRKTLFTENKLSADKQNLFKIPESKITNTD